MLLDTALADWFGALVTEINSSSSVLLALVLIGAGVCLVLGSRRGTPRAGLVARLAECSEPADKARDRQERADH